MVGGDKEHSDTGRLRYQGCIDSCTEHGIDFDPERDYRGVRFSYQDGYDATKSLIESKKEFSALFAAADVMAIGAIRALKDAGLRVPEDVSVIGFDGLMLGSFLVPKLSTVEQSVELMAKRSVDILLRCIENKGSAEHRIVPFLVRQRESTKDL